MKYWLWVLLNAVVKALKAKAVAKAAKANNVYDIVAIKKNVPDANVGNIIKNQEGLCMDPVLDKIIGQLINALAGAIITYLVTMLRQKKQQIEEQRKENEALKAGVQALLRDRIIQAYNHYSDKGWIPIYAMQSIEACYHSYEELGENGVIDNLMRQLRELSNHEPEEQSE